MVLWQECVLRETLANQKEHADKNPVDDFLLCPNILGEIKVFSPLFIFSFYSKWKVQISVNRSPFNTRLSAMAKPLSSS